MLFSRRFPVAHAWRDSGLDPLHLDVGQRKSTLHFMEAVGQPLMLIGWLCACVMCSQLLATMRISPSPDMTVYGVHLNPINATKCVAHGNRVLRLMSIDDDR